MKRRIAALATLTLAGVAGAASPKTLSPPDVGIAGITSFLDEMRKGQEVHCQAQIYGQPVLGFLWRPTVAEPTARAESLVAARAAILEELDEQATGYRYHCRYQDGLVVTVSLSSLKTLWSGLGMGFQEGFWIDGEK